ncbi:hypothetical protein BO71DRAFT_409598 [Aspergillus ellipticus CBS 707.79]|uniref:Uncharacterized protein n=1 Tax=Aspergillus ellipticus CBS 707.79 TaxID=1448320 RepID=A0A319DAD0_9EURO|nr:hypothetical protein BO71DRAFT_409598 [Aspergillus ellipticus CBS 707.79]
MAISGSVTLMARGFPKVIFRTVVAYLACGGARHGRFLYSVERLRLKLSTRNYKLENILVFFKQLLKAAGSADPDIYTYISTVTEILIKNLSRAVWMTITDQVTRSAAKIFTAIFIPREARKIF